MPRVEIPLQEPGPNGFIASLTFTAADAANDHFFDNSSGRVELHIRNDDNAGKTVTVVAVSDPFGRVTDHSVVMAATGGGASEMGHVPPLSPTAWNQRGVGVLGQVFVDITDAVDLSFAAVKLPLGRP